MNSYLLHDTPHDIAKCLASEAPRGVKTILEPSAGNGILADAICEKISYLEHLVCVDIDSDITETLKTKFHPTLGEKIDIINSNFLQWSLEVGKESYANYFDCIIMNPPFIARKDKCVNINWFKEHSVPSKVPLEIAFILHSLPLLKDKGILLSILPTSAISSKRIKWFRKLLLSKGRIESVHELPEYSFPNIESKVYLFVFKKGVEETSIILKNHSLKDPDTIEISNKNLNIDLRLDYNFYQSKYWLEKIENYNAEFNWVKLGQEALVIRGKEKSPDGVPFSVHTTEFEQGFWNASPNKKYEISETQYSIKEHDILVKRVGRNCSSSISLPLGMIGYKCSDCVLIIKPNKPEIRNKILFSFRVLYCNNRGGNYLERGTGAKYLSVKDIRNCKIPLSLCNHFGQDFQSYEFAIQKQDFEKMCSIEKKIFKILTD